MNELIIPTNLKDALEPRRPNRDAQYDRYLTDPILAPVVNSLFGLQIPTTGRTDLQAIFHSGLPNLNAVRLESRTCCG